MKKLVFVIFLFPHIVLSQNQQELSHGLELLEKSETFYQKSQLDSAYHYAKQSFDIFNALKIDSLKNRSLLKLIMVTDDEAKRNEYVDEAKRIAEETKNPELLAEIDYANGRYYFNEREYATALPFFLRVDSISKKFNLVNETTIRSVLDRSEISRRTFTSSGIEAAHDLQNEALALAERIKSEKLINAIYLRLADMSGLIGNYGKAKYYLDLVYPYYKKSDDTENLTKVYMDYMNYYYSIHNFDKAGEKLEEGITYLRTKNDSLRLARLIAMHGAFFSERKGDCVKAIEQLKEAEKIYSNIDHGLSDSFMYLMEDIAKCSEEIGDYKSASIYYKRAYEIDNQRIKKANSALARKLETKYQAQQKEHEIELLQSQSALASQQRKNQRNLFLGGMGLTTFASLFFLFLFRNRQKTNKKLKELDSAKSNFFVNISHEFRTPLTLIQSPIDQELEKDSLESSQRKMFLMIKRSSQRLLSLVDQLLMLSKIESKALVLQVQEVDLQEFLRAITSSFVYGFKQKHIEFVPKININAKGFVDVDIFEKIVTNLLSNALKYTPEHGIVKLNAKDESGMLLIQISNSGKTLTPEELNSIFKKFYQVDSSQQGYGIGLTLVKELTGAHRGSIAACSTNDLTTFTISLPIGKSYYHDKEIAIIPKLIGSETQSLWEEETAFDFENEKYAATNKPILLLVEDGNDMRNFIKNLFSDSYEVIEAKNGKEGIESALRHIPDIIISDIMMPEVDGLELAKTLKENQRTSHIPIIVLTAKEVIARQSRKVAGALQSRSSAETGNIQL